MSESKTLSERDLPFRKVRSKQEAPKCEGEPLGRRAAKAVTGAVLTGDPSGAVVGIVTDSIVDKFWPKKR